MVLMLLTRQDKSSVDLLSCAQARPSARAVGVCRATVALLGLRGINMAIRDNDVACEISDSKETRHRCTLVLELGRILYCY